MLQAALDSGAAHRRSVFELFPRRLPAGRRYGVVAGVGRALDAIEAFRFTDARDRAAARAADRRRADARLPGRLPLQRRHLGLPRGRDLLPLLPAAGRRVDVRRGGAAGDRAALDLQPRLGDRLGRLADDVGRRRAAVHRDGLAPYPRVGGGGRRPRGVRRRLHRHLQPARPPGVRRPDHRHQRALLHAAARHRGRRLPRAGRLARQGHHAARRHLRHRRGRAARRRGRRPRPRRGPHRLRRPRPARPPGARPARRARRDADPHHRHLRPRRVRDRRARRRPRSTATASAPSWSPAAATRPAASSTSWSPARTPTASWSGSPRRARTRSRSAAASTPCAGSPPTASPRPR